MSAHRRGDARIRAAKRSSPLQPEVTMQKWACTMCDYVYDPEVGDPDGDIPPGTAFEDLPDGWECPVCGAPKTEFKPLD